MPYASPPPQQPRSVRRKSGQIARSVRFDATCSFVKRRLKACCQAVRPDTAGWAGLAKPAYQA